MSEDVKELLDSEFGEVLDELYQVGLDGIKQVVQKLVDHYFDNYEIDPSILYNQMLIALTEVTGQTLACIDDDGNLRDFILERCVENIEEARKAAEADELSTDEDPYGLARMSTQGNC